MTDITKDIADLREVAGIGETSDWMTWPKVDPAKLKRVLDMLEAERQRADAESVGADKCAEDCLHWMKRAKKAEAEIAALKGEQVPVAYLYMGDAMECKHVELAEDRDEGQAKNCFPLFTAPQKPVVWLGDIAIHDDLHEVGALVSYDDVVAAIEAAGAS